MFCTRNKITYFFILSLFLFGCSKNIKSDYVSFNGEAQGTTFFISYKDSLNRDLSSEIKQILVNFDQEVSTYKTNSVINKFNYNIIDTLFVKKYSYLPTCFKLSSELKSYTNGYFDSGLQPLFNFFKKHKYIVNEGNVLLDSVLSVERKFEQTENAIFKKDEKSQFNFNAIAQGYSVDVLSDFFVSKGIKDFMIEIGGEVKVKGRNSRGKKWTVSLEAPDSKIEARKVQEIVSLHNKSIVTSGSYRKFKIINGIRYSHAVNPFTGIGVTHNLLSVTVITNDCGVADALATAFLVMGKEKTISFLEKENKFDASVMFIESNSDSTYFTSFYGDFKKYLIDN